jgi:cytoskeleton-associated protein 5
LETLQKPVSVALTNTNPKVRAQTAFFLAKCFCKSTPAALSNTLFQLYTEPLLKNLGDSDGDVRIEAMRALDVAMKLVEEKEFNEHRIKDITPNVPQRTTLSASLRNYF